MEHIKSETKWIRQTRGKNKKRPLYDHTLHLLQFERHFYIFYRFTTRQSSAWHRWSICRESIRLSCSHYTTLTLCSKSAYYSDRRYHQSPIFVDCFRSKLKRIHNSIVILVSSQPCSDMCHSFYQLRFSSLLRNCSRLKSGARAATNTEEVPFSLSRGLQVRPKFFCDYLFR